jgi:hypothetical protein
MSLPPTVIDEDTLRLAEDALRATDEPERFMEMLDDALGKRESHNDV